MPQLSSQFLQNHRELRLAHLALGTMTMGYVWQEGENDTVEVFFVSFPWYQFYNLKFNEWPFILKSLSKMLPRCLAVPYWEVSQRLGLPPILTHADGVLANWKKKDPEGWGCLLSKCGLIVSWTNITYKSAFFLSVFIFMSPVPDPST